MKTLVTLFIIAVSLTGDAVSELQSSAADSAAADNRISLAIATKQNSFKTGENVLLSIVVKNNSTEDYCEGHFLETGEAELNGYEAEVYDTSGKAYPQTPILKSRWRRSRGKLCIKPGEIIRESLSIDKVVDLSAPGTYQIQVKHLDRGNNTSVQSNSIIITVTP